MSAGSRSDVVVVGASVAGIHVAEQLRGYGFAGSVTVVGAEPHLPYDRPPLSKQLLLGTWDRDQVTLRSREELEGLDVSLRLGVCATSWDGQNLTLSDDSTLTADRLVVATGVQPRMLPGQPDHDAIGTLRTIDDAEWLNGRLRRGGTVVVVGGGFIGAEVASSARQLGCEVVILEATELPLQRVLGEDGARLVARVFDDAGVEFRGASTVANLSIDGDRLQIALADGQCLSADSVVVGIGSVPQTHWLGIEGSEGIHCDSRGRATEIPNAYAVGDVAAWPAAHDGVPVRHEHWTNARTQAAAVAADIAGVAPKQDEPEYFWTDQFGLMIQVIGAPRRADRTIVVQPGEGVRRSVVLYLQGSLLVGCALFSAPRLLRTFTTFVHDGVDEATALAALAR